MTYKIKNWQKHQHFKDRRPPWVKLYRDLLEDPDWHELSGDDAKLLVSLWLVASEDESMTGTLPDTRVLAFRLRTTETKIKQSLTKLSIWLIQDDINPISTRYQTDAPETETETETENRERERAETKQKTATASRLPADWMPTVVDLEFLKAERPDLQASNVIDGFRDYWIAQPGAKGRKLDWAATWRNWIRNQRSGSAARFLTPQQQRDENNRRSTAEFLADDTPIFGAGSIIEGECSNA